MQVFLKRMSAILLALLLAFIPAAGSLQPVHAAAIPMEYALTYDAWAWIFASLGYSIAPFVDDQKVYMDRFTEEQLEVLPEGFDIAYSEAVQSRPNLLADAASDISDTFDYWCRENGFDEYIGQAGAWILDNGDISIPKEAYAVLQEFAEDFGEEFADFTHVQVESSFENVIRGIAGDSSYTDSLISRIHSVESGSVYSDCLYTMMLPENFCLGSIDGPCLIISYIYSSSVDGAVASVRENNSSWILDLGYDSYSSGILYVKDGVACRYDYGSSFFNNGRSLVTDKYFYQDFALVGVNGVAYETRDLIVMPGTVGASIRQAAEKLKEGEWGIYTPTKQDFRLIETNDPNGKPKKEIQGNIILPGIIGGDQDRLIMTGSNIDSVSNGQTAPEDALSQVGVGIVDLPGTEPGALPSYAVEPVKPVQPDPDPEPSTEDDVPLIPSVPGGAGDITKLFPFCIPFDLFFGMSLFLKEQEAPVFDFEYEIKPINYTFRVHVDMADYEYYVNIFRSGMAILFVLGLMFGTRKLTNWLKGGT